MKRFIFLSAVLIFTILSVQSLVAMPLVLKTTKELKSGGELLTFDTSQYKNIRIGVSIISGGGVALTDDVKIEAIEGDESMLIDYMGVYKRVPARTISVDNVPSKIRLTASIAGTYKIFIWASN